jgi:Flp pilus assembly protein TadB
MLVLACLAVFLFVYLLAWHFLRPKEVSIREEWSIRHDEGSGLTNIITITVCGLVCAIAAYGVTGTLLFAGIAFFGGYFVAKWLSTRRQNTRDEMLRTQYGQVLSSLASAMQGGLMHYQALEELTPVLPQPSKNVFTEILARGQDRFITSSSNQKCRKSCSVEGSRINGCGF